jgi:hypothetical protein
MPLSYGGVGIGTLFLVDAAAVVPKIGVRTTTVTLLELPSHGRNEVWPLRDWDS